MRGREAGVAELRPGGIQLGTALLEMLLACALLGMLLLSATSAHVSALQAGEVSREAAHRGQISELAAELLHYHLGLAGYRGVASPADLQGPAMVLSRGSEGGSDALEVRYVEERWYAEPELRAVRFDVRRDGAGRWNLYQQEEGASRQPAVQHVSGLRVERLVAVDGTVSTGEIELPVDIVALELTLEFGWGASRTVAVGLPRVVRLVEEIP